MISYIQKIELDYALMIVHSKHDFMKIILATNNPHKVQELNSLLATSQHHIHPQSDFNVTPIDETGLTFVENAILKARHACEQTKLPAIADDSGLEVDTLHGKPGIHSARYAGETANAQDNIDKLLSQLQGIPPEKRRARFQCVMVFMLHATDATPIICQGTWEGQILCKPQGTMGFGYDPIFYLPTFKCSAAELPLEVKNRISHRGQALIKLQSILQNLK
jgi:XTP/dITP diphosphohydrolase